MTMNHRYAAVLMILAGACMTEGGDPPADPRTGLDIRITAANDAPAVLVIDTTDLAACVADGCPTGQVCDWVQGCTDEVTFCCGDGQCGKNRFCDFEAGGVCTPDP
jgi:hypothetical protein